MSFVIAIAGGSCSGKTTFARKLRTRLGEEECLSIQQDDYYFDIRMRQAGDTLPNFDIPEALDFEQFASDLRALKAGTPVALPNYDFKTHQRCHPSEPLVPRPFIIIEGLLVLNAPEIRPLIDYSLYIECSREERFSRRLARDIKERARTEDSVYKQFHEDVEPAHQSFVAPSAQYADEVIPQAVYKNELPSLIDRVIDTLPPAQQVEPMPVELRRKRAVSL